MLFAVFLGLVGIVLFGIGLVMASLAYEEGVMTRMNFPVGLFCGFGPVAMRFCVVLNRETTGSRS
jgi:hypothetical protein